MGQLKILSFVGVLWGKRAARRDLLALRRPLGDINVWERVEIPYWGLLG